MDPYLTDLIPALAEGLDAIVNHIGRPLSGEKELLEGVQRAIDRRNSIVALLDAAKNFIRLNGLSEQSLKCLAIVKTIIAHDDNDMNIYSLHIIFSSRKNSLVRKMASSSGVPLSEAKSFLWGQPLIGALLEGAANHYRELYSRFTKMRKDLGAEDNSTDIHALIGTNIIRCNWTHPTQSVFTIICGGNIFSVKRLPTSSTSWATFLSRRLSVKQQALKPKLERRVEALKPKPNVVVLTSGSSDDDDDDDEQLTLTQFGEKQAIEVDATEVVTKEGWIYQFGVLKVGANGCVNPYFKGQVARRSRN